MTNGSSENPKSENLLTLLPPNWEDLPDFDQEEILRQLSERLASTSPKETEAQKFLKYQHYPERFASEVLGVTWWSDQIKFAHLIRDNDRSACRAGHSVGKCVAATERIRLSDGTWIKAASLIDRSFFVHSVDAEWNVNVSRAFATDNGVRPVVEIVTDRGRRARRTLNHPFVTASSRFAAAQRTKVGKPKWVEAETLKPGDLILVVDDCNISRVVPMPDAEVRVLACLIGDGGLTGRTVHFSQDYGPLLDEFESDIDTLGARLRKIPDSFDWNIVANHCATRSKPNAVKTLVRAHGLWNMGSYDKHVPHAIFGLPDDQLAMFLSRLYATDGWATSSDRQGWKNSGRVEIGYSTVSYRLAVDVHRLLLRFGIHGTLRRKKTSWAHNGIKKWSHSYSVDILAASDVVKFAERIGIYGKEEQLAEAVKRAKKRTKRWVWSTRFAPQGFRWEKVKSVEVLPAEATVAITVPGDETFLTEFVEHNTMAIGGIVNWFLHCYQPSIVVTTAPSTNQVTQEIWKEVRTQAARSRLPLLGGLMPKKPHWQITEEHYATGFSTDTGDRFRGKHGPHMLFVLDEATGVPDFVWDEVENMCTAPGNRIVAIGNPINPSGAFYDCFKSNSGWATMKISCLDHPNVIHGRQIFPGAVSREWVERRIQKFCSEINEADADPSIDFQWPAGSGEWYRPSAVFQCRVQGEFPTEGPDTLISFSQVVYARSRPPLLIDDLSSVDMGLDVAYQGGDACVLMCRRGQSVIRREKWYGRDPEQSKRKVLGVCKDLQRQGLRIGTIAIDAIGIGSGVAHGLRAMKDDGDLTAHRVIAVQVSEKATNVEKYENRRAELSFALAERFRQGNVDLSRLGADAEDFENQAPQIKWSYDRLGRYRVESKDDIRKRLKLSPDDFDAMYLCFIDTADTFAENYALVMSVG